MSSRLEMESQHNFTLLPLRRGAYVINILLLYRPFPNVFFHSRPPQFNTHEKCHKTWIRVDDDNRNI